MAFYADKNQIIISSLEVVDTIPIQEKDDFYSIVMRVKLNNSGSSEADDLSVTVLRNGEVIVKRTVELGVEVYDLGIEARKGDFIEVMVSGEQILPKGVYFYEPEGGRDISQSLVGVAAGMTDIYAKATVTPEFPEIEPASANRDGHRFKNHRSTDFNYSYFNGICIPLCRQIIRQT